MSILTLENQMTGKPDSPVPAKVKPAKRRGEAIIISLLSITSSIDPRALIGVTMILIGVMIAGGPLVGTSGYMAKIGIPPSTFALILAFCGSLILHRPQSNLFILLTVPFAFYIMVAWAFINTQSDLSSAPVIIYVAFYVLILRTGAEKSG